ncbi:MAG TPA: YhcH/YjgK/YiaL family protein [Phycisphaerales bacterium]|nr:YhcH/YjgK/YiaL family protein [Phycisphaerales bacterium]
MILDVVERLDAYSAMHKRFTRAFAWLRSEEARRIEPAGVGQEHSVRVAIDGEDVFAIVQRYMTKRMEDEGRQGGGGPFWEAHRKYIDVQCVLEGEEVMGWSPLNRMRTKSEYNEEKDFEVLVRGMDSPCQMLRVPTGMCAVFFPEDAHMPGLAVDGKIAEVKKVVVKVRV